MKQKITRKYLDLLGNELQLGDLVLLVNSRYCTSISMEIITRFTPCKINGTHEPNTVVKLNQDYTHLQHKIQNAINTKAQGSHSFYERFHEFGKVIETK